MSLQVCSLYLSHTDLKGSYYHVATVTIVFTCTGPAYQSSVPTSKASSRHPAGIDMLIIEPGKNEIALVCNKGNSCIRFIKGVHSFNANHFVGTLKLHSLPSLCNNWKPEGLAVVGSLTIAVTEGNGLYLVHMDDTFAAGQIVKVVDHLQSPNGLCLSSTPETVFVADGHTIKQVNLETKTITVAAQGFKQALDVALSSNGNLGVTDVQAHKISIPEEKENGNYGVHFIGTANAGCLDGPASKAQLLGPTGLCFDRDTALFCCFGGSKTGYIRLHTRVEFACRFMSIIRQMYHSIGFLPKKENHLAQIGRKHTAPLVEGTNNLIDSLANLEGLIAQQKDYLKIARAGPKGTVYHVSVQGFSETVKSLEAHIQSFEMLGRPDILTGLNLYAFVNEFRKEHGFAKHKQTGQYRHPTQQQYVRSKGHYETELIKKTCQCPHSYQTNSFSAYQPTHSSSLSCVETIVQYKKWSEKFAPLSRMQPRQTSLGENLKVARMLNVLT